MSRREVENEKWMIAIGADSVTGSFIQVWNQPHDEQDQPIIVIDNMGVSPREDLSSTPGTFQAIVTETAQRFELARSKGNHYPNLDADTMCRMAKALGFDSSVDRIIYEALD